MARKSQVADEVANFILAEREIIAAYILDRAEQYSPSSGYVEALCQLAGNIIRDEAGEAFRHGELDDLMPRVRRMRGRGVKEGA